jgi:hypothetical protein
VAVEGYALNMNDTNGVLANEVMEKQINEKERSLACYYLV